jgi:serine protease Do
MNGLFYFQRPRQIAICISVLGLLGVYQTPATFAQSRPSFSYSGNNPRKTQCVEVAERVKSAVVDIQSERTISNLQRDPDAAINSATQRVNGMGTGIVIDPRGYIITNHHVVDDVQLLRVELADGSNLPARVIARDADADLALIKVEVAKPLPVCPLGTTDDLMDGEPVIAIGNAFGYKHTITTGIVSAQKRNVTLNKEISYKNVIQTDASINPGNSGGPLLNARGELIGVNVAIRAGAQGIAFAIPVDSMLTVAADLLSIRRKNGLYHGLALRNMVEVNDNGARRWAVIEKLDQRLITTETNLQLGDVIDRVNDQNVATSLDLERALLDAKAGDKITVQGRRAVGSNGQGGTEFKGEFVLRGVGVLQANTGIVGAGMAQGDVIQKKLGVKLQTVSAELVSRINNQLHGGLLVTEVAANTPAAKAGFQRGDILIGLHTWETITADNVHFVLTHPEQATFSPMRFFLIRNGALQKGYLGNLE